MGGDFAGRGGLGCEEGWEGDVKKGGGCEEGGGGKGGEEEVKGAGRRKEVIRVFVFFFCFCFWLFFLLFFCLFFFCFWLFLFSKRERGGRRPLLSAIEEVYQGGIASSEEEKFLERGVEGEGVR